MQDSGTKWILDKWTEELGRTLESMIDERPMIECDASEDEPEAGPDTLVLETVFSLHSEPAFWISCPAESTREIGSRILRTAGIEDSGPEEIQNTCLEVLEQCQVGLTHGLTRQMQRTITSQSREAPVLPTHIESFRVTVTFADAAPFSLFIAFSPVLPASLSVITANSTPAQVAAVTAAGLAPEVVVPVAAAAVKSKTFDVLLDVSMPVSVSFGKTEMAVKDVLKLTTVSIVELNRTVSEPVEVVVNGCVIARGEVVVIDGNYGVRIIEIASRQDRLRTGTSSVARAKKEVAV